MEVLQLFGSKNKKKFFSTSQLLKRAWLVLLPKRSHTICNVDKKLHHSYREKNPTDFDRNYVNTRHEFTILLK